MAMEDALVLANYLDHHEPRRRRRAAALLGRAGAPRRRHRAPGHRPGPHCPTPTTRAAPRPGTRELARRGRRRHHRRHLQVDPDRAVPVSAAHDDRRRRRLTCHVLDVTRGRPAAGVGVASRALDGPTSPRSLVTAATNADGRTDAPLLAGDDLAPGRYELAFAVGDYFAATAGRRRADRFLDVVPVRFGVAPGTAPRARRPARDPVVVHDLPGQLTGVADAAHHRRGRTRSTTRRSSADVRPRVRGHARPGRRGVGRPAVRRPRRARLAAFVAAADGLDDDGVLALLRAHPQLGRGAPMTAASQRRAARRPASTDARRPRPRRRSAPATPRYLDRFGFPFIIAVRGLGPADDRRRARPSGSSHDAERGAGRGAGAGAAHRRAAHRRRWSQP